jgi:hypothetical protein
MTFVTAFCAAITVDTESQWLSQIICRVYAARRLVDG